MVSKKKTQWVDVQSPAELKAGDWVRFQYVHLTQGTTRCEGEVRVGRSTYRWVGRTNLSGGMDETYLLDNGKFADEVSGVQVRRKVKPLKPGFYARKVPGGNVEAYKVGAEGWISEGFLNDDNRVPNVGERPAWLGEAAEAIRSGAAVFLGGLDD